MRILLALVFVWFVFCLTKKEGERNGTAGH